MGRFRVYIQPFNDDGTYSGSWTEVTEDVESNGVSTMKQSLDNNEYDVGIFKNSGVTLSLINLEGRYSNVGEPGSIFKFRRSNSLVRITWVDNDQDPICGFFKCGGGVLTEEVVAFEGLLDDQALKQNADEQNLKFKVIGKEGIFQEAIVPFSSLAVGNTFAQLIYTILNQSAITALLTVDALNISCNVNVAVDSIADLEKKTVREALSDILLYSNSVLYIIDDVIYVSPRTAGATTAYTFYGQGATQGTENIIDLSDYRIGFNRLFNFATWKDTTTSAEDPTSITNNGYKKKEIETSLITDNTKRTTILTSLVTEFKNPKREMILKVAIDHETIALNVLDKVSIDYPNIGINDEAAIPLWDLAVWDEDVYPNEVLPIAIESSAEFKILSRDIDPANHEMIFYVREV